MLVGGAGRGGSSVITLVTQHLAFCRVNLLMFPQRGGMSVGLVAAPDSAVVRLVSGVDMHVLLPVAGVGEPSVTALYLALEWFLTWNKRNVSYVVEDNQPISNELLMNQCRAMY